VIDPFAGTGSMLHTSAMLGATVVGTDIDARTMRGSKGETRLTMHFVLLTCADHSVIVAVPGEATGVTKAAKSYGVADRILDCLQMDFTQPAWRTNFMSRGAMFDAIVTDRESCVPRTLILLYVTQQMTLCSSIWRPGRCEKAGLHQA
jgi:tRNA G10  N-methylase Trm11